MSNFKPFAAAVALQFKSMSKEELFRVNIPGDEYAMKLDTFLAMPENERPEVADADMQLMAD